ncbi:MAG TPA: DUF6295 family protein [Chloroflexota bacterium]|nr:DUF6295 family protein [Chloroflexota bacterium]
MCTYIVEHADLAGSAKGQLGWFPLNRAHVAFDHPVSAPLDHALLIDFVNEAQGPGARVAVELSAESARDLAFAILTALKAAEAENVVEPGLVGAVPQP